MSDRLCVEVAEATLFDALDSLRETRGEPAVSGLRDYVVAMAAEIRAAREEAAKRELCKAGRCADRVRAENEAANHYRVECPLCGRCWAAGVLDVPRWEAECRRRGEEDESREQLHDCPDCDCDEDEWFGGGES